MGPVAEFQDRRDEIDDDGGEELPHVVVVRIVDIAIDETEVQRRREKNDEAKDHFLAVHGNPPS